jgi:hypothetical protein
MLDVDFRFSSGYRSKPISFAETQVGVECGPFQWLSCAGVLPCVNKYAQILVVSSQFLTVSLALASALLSIDPAFRLQAFWFACVLRENCLAIMTMTTFKVPTAALHLLAIASGGAGDGGRSWAWGWRWRCTTELWEDGICRHEDWAHHFPGSCLRAFALALYRPVFYRWRLQYIWSSVPGAGGLLQWSVLYYPFMPSSCYT